MNLPRSGKIFSFLLFNVLFILFTSRNVYAGTVTLTPAIAVAGQEVFITGSTFDNSSLVTVTYDGVTLTTIPSSFSTSAAGAIPANVSFIIPSSNFGLHTVRVSTSAGNYANATLTISTPSVAISSPTVPLTGIAVGAYLTVLASNVEANKTTSFYFDDTLVGTATSSTNGSAQFVFQTPDVTNTGTHLIRTSNSVYAVASTTILLAAPTIVLTPATSSIGTQVSVVGSNFKVNSTVIFFLNGLVLTMDSSVTSNGAGGFSASFVIPTSALGVNIIKAQTSSNLFAATTLTISTPVIVLTPAISAVGTQVNIVGSNFKANSVVTFFLNGGELTMESSVTSNSTGGFLGTFIVPSSALGINTIKAQTSSNFFATGTLTISTPLVTLVPITGPVGTPVFVSGTGFIANAVINFYINGAIMTDTAIANSLGSFTKAIVIPANLYAGIYTIRAQADSLSFGNAPFTAVAPTLTLSVAIGTPGTRVAITGLNYNPSSDVIIKWNGALILPIESSLKTSSSGGFIANITVPTGYTAGTNQIEVSTGINSTLVTSFVVNTPTLTLSAITAYPGTKLSITGINFEGNRPVKLFFDGAPLMPEIANLTTTTLGGFSTVITIPSASRGVHAITASTGTDKITFSATLTIIAPALTTPATSQANKKISVVVVGFLPNEQVTFLWDNEITLKTASEKVFADNAGYVSDFVTLPSNASSGFHTLRAVSSSKLIADSTITITTGSVTQSRVNGPSLSKITLIGSSFDTNSLVQFFWDEKELSTDEIKTDGIGGFSAVITIPISNIGNHSLRIKTSNLGMTVTDFTIDTPLIQIQPDNAWAGEEITIKGSGFAIGREIQILLNNYKVIIGPEMLITDGNGNFSTTIRLPFLFDPRMKVTVFTSDEDRTEMYYTVTIGLIPELLGKYGLPATLITILAIIIAIAILKHVELKSFAIRIYDQVKGRFVRTSSTNRTKLR